MKPQMPRILVVDDEPALVQLVSMNLMLECFEVVAAVCGKEALEKCQGFGPDLIILDVMMPDMDGFEVLSAVRRFSSVPVLMLTARSRVDDRVRGLNAGADDYLAKPFSLEELLARVRALLRRSSLTGKPAGISGTGPFEVLRSGEIVCNVPEHRATVSGREVPLQRLEFRLLCAFLRAGPRVLTHDFLCSTVWASGDGDIETLRVTVGKLRSKLKRASGRDPIETLHGVGYRLRKEEPPEEKRGPH